MHTEIVSRYPNSSATTKRQQTKIAHRGSRFWRVLLLLTANVLLTLPIPNSAGQTTSESSEPNQVTPAANTAAGIKLGKAYESEWEFGINIKAAPSATNIDASFPIPMSWPEQEIEVVEQSFSAGISKTTESNPTDATRQVSIRIPRLANGAAESAIVKFRIKKRFIIAPTETARYVIPAKPAREVRTYLKPSPYIESRHRKIRAIAADLRDESLGGWEQVEAIYRWVRENVQYKFDQQIHSCLDALETKTGDCEELSSLFIAICRAQGIPARAVWVPGHTYPEFYLEDESGKGHWFPCQAAGSYEFGGMSESKPILQKGDRFRVAGQSQEVRYVIPTAKSQGPVSLEWINRNTRPPAAPAGSAETISGAGSK